MTYGHLSKFIHQAICRCSLVHMRAPGEVYEFSPLQFYFLLAGPLVGCIFFVGFGLAHGKGKKEDSKEKEEKEVVLGKTLAYKDPKRLCRNHR